MSAGDLTVRPSRPTPQALEWHRAARKARLLSSLSLAWMGTEGAVMDSTCKASASMT